MSKYFPLPEIYIHRNVYSIPLADHIYSMLRAILHDPAKYPDPMRWALQKQSGFTWNIKPARTSEKSTLVSLPYDGSVHAAALMVKMGTHTLEETWEEYKDLWYEDLAAQVAHLEKGTGP